MNGRHRFLALAIALLALAPLGCRSRTDRSEGSVIFSVNRFNALPVSVSVTNGPTQIPEIVLRNVAKDPTGTTSNLQDIELRSYEVRYARLDAGTTLPQVLVEAIFGTIQVNNTATFNNLVFLRDSQLANPPLSDLARNGRDTQTGSTSVPMRITLTFFGRTLSGDNVATQPASFDIEVRP